MQSIAYLIGTCDTKAAELRYLRERLADAGVASCIVDVGTQEMTMAPPT